MSEVRYAHSSAPSGSHTPDEALALAFRWLSRTQAGFVSCVLLTLPGRLHLNQEQELFGECQRVLGEGKPLFVWGQTTGLLKNGWEIERITGDLSLCYCGWDKPSLINIPLLNSTVQSSECPPALTEWALRASCSEGYAAYSKPLVIYDIFPRAGHIALALGRALGCRVLTLGPVSDSHTQSADDVPCPSWAKSKAFIDEFNSRLVRVSSGCALYQGKGNPYCRLKVFGVEWLSHRLAWVLHHKVGLPEGMPVLHSCVNKTCCEPSHLRIGGTPLVGTVLNQQERRVMERGKSL